MTIYGALRGLGYLARDVWGAVLNASQPRSRTGFAEHYAEVLAGREAETEVAEPIFGSLRDIPRAEPRTVLTAVPIRDCDADDEAQTDCGLGGAGRFAFNADIVAGDGQDKYIGFRCADFDTVELVSDTEFLNILHGGGRPKPRTNTVTRAAAAIEGLAETLGLVDRLTSAAPAADTDAAADAPPPDFPPRRGAPTSAVVDPFTWAAVDGPAPSNPLPGAGPHQLTSGDLRAGALAAREKATTCDPADAPGWAALGHRLIQAAHAMTLRAAMNDTNPENVEVDGYDR